MRSDLVVIKLGGASLLDPNTQAEVINAIREYRKYDYDVVLVHGGGPAINAELTKQNISWSFVNGQRVTTPEMISVIHDVLFNTVNADLVNRLADADIPAIGLSGAKNNLLFCSQANPELGLVGQVDMVSTDKINNILEQNFVPVIAPIGLGVSGELYNINADWAAAKIAAALKATKLIFLTDQNGILDTDQNLIEFADHETLQRLLKTETVSGGMYTKVLTVVDALNNGVSQVRILRGIQACDGLWSDEVGTMCTLTQALAPNHFFNENNTEELLSC